MPSRVTKRKELPYWLQMAIVWLVLFLALLVAGILHIVYFFEELYHGESRYPPKKKEE